jgi:hypothetical protein
MLFRHGTIKIKSAQTDSGVIKFEGFANRADETDRHGEVIPKEEWLLKNYRLNPILLLNHDPYFALGQSKEEIAEDNGLKISAEVSSPSKDPETVRIKANLIGPE